MANKWGRNGNSGRLYFPGLQIIVDSDCSQEIKRRLLLRRKAKRKLDIIFKNRDIVLWTKVHIVKAMVFPVIMYGCESWTIKGQAGKNWCFWTMVFEKTLENALDSKEIKPVSPKGNQPWVFLGRTDAEAEVPILWPHNTKSQLVGKDPVSGKDRRHEEKEATEGEIVGWHHWYNGHEFEQTAGDNEI